MHVNGVVVRFFFGFFASEETPTRFFKIVLECASKRKRRLATELNQQCTIHVDSRMQMPPSFSSAQRLVEMLQSNQQFSSSVPFFGNGR